MNKGFEFNGNGAELLGKFFVGIVLCFLTLGIYYPWFIVSITQYTYKKTICKSETGNITFRFTGDGASLFGNLIIGFILTIITFGLYAPWFMVNMTRYFWDNSHGETADGRTYKLQFKGSGGELFGIFLLGYILTILTLGIYGAWFICSLVTFYAKKTVILDQSDKPYGTVAFSGHGGTLLGTWILGIIFCIITFGIYTPWFTVQLIKFYTSHTRVTIDNKTYVGGFVGMGGDLFFIHLVGYILTLITLGIYGAWYFCSLQKFQINNLTYEDAPSLG